MSTFGERLKKAREQAGINQIELAERMGITQASISQYEKGLRIPTPKNIEKFTVVLGVSKEDLAGGNNAKFEQEMLMRNLKNLTPQSLKKINEYVELLKSAEKNK